MAWNIPFSLQTYQWDASKARLPMTPNPDFVAQVKEVAAPDDMLLVMCRSGGRSALAVNRLAEAGFRNVYTSSMAWKGMRSRIPKASFMARG